MKDAGILCLCVECDGPIYRYFDGTEVVEYTTTDAHGETAVLLYHAACYEAVIDVAIDALIEDARLAIAA